MRYGPWPRSSSSRRKTIKKDPADTLNDSNRGSNGDEWNPREHVSANERDGARETFEGMEKEGKRIVKNVDRRSSKAERKKTKRW